jgi:hypothetical protein
MIENGVSDSKTKTDGHLMIENGVSDSKTKTDGHLRIENCVSGAFLLLLIAQLRQTQEVQEDSHGLTLGIRVACKRLHDSVFWPGGAK